MKLTQEQRDLMLNLGDSEPVPEAIPTEVLQQLIDLGLAYKRQSDGHFDFTDLGESVYDGLKGQ